VHYQLAQRNEFTRAPKAASTIPGSQSCILCKCLS
jgi:hypothetical protein